jgi:hypothetical protein
MGWLLSLFCKHEWGGWTLHSPSEGHYDQEYWWIRTCTKCGKTEISNLVDDTKETN